MPDLLRSRPRLAALVAVSFTGGVLLATGMDWTSRSGATPLLQAAPTPSHRDIKPVADLSDAFITIAESVTPAVVSIHTEKTPRRRAGGDLPPELRERVPYLNLPEGHPQVPETTNGSGFVISADGYIITNNHVVAGADQITVILQDNRQLEGRLVGRDPNTDIAVVKVDGGRLPAVRLGSSEGTRIGEWVLAIGNPLDLGTTVTSGIVSAKGRALDNLLAQNANGSQWAIEDFIQTDAPINPGNSGGPLVNLHGEVVGVNSAIASPTGLYAGYGFAVPIDLARRIAEDLMRLGRVRRPALGVQVTEVTPEDAEVYRLSRIQGVVAQDFPARSPARDAGIRRGDVIVAINGNTVERVGQFQRLVASNRPGDRVAVDVVRYGERKRVEVELMEAQTGRVAANEPAPAAASDARTGRLGISLGPLTAATAKQLGYADVRGLLVTDVAPFGPAARAGVQRGMRVLAVDGAAVADAASFRRTLDRKRPGSVVSLVVGFPGGQQSIFNVRLPRQ
jgi:serine protease Do